MSLGVATSSQASLPQELSVYGDGYFSGSVGIGTLNPGHTLDIGGALRFQPSSEPAGADGAMYYDSTTDKLRCYEGGGWRNCDVASQLTGGSANYIPLWTGATTQGISTIYQLSSNIGIGIASPGTKLHVEGGDIAATTLGTGLILKAPNGSCHRVIVRNNGSLDTNEVACP